ncbi:uncharacterized protein LOC114937269 [Nylanderia fulva]|uniref:uncharacterized protein LOC114937269 n=1 Tax=Nylanderia fulva TaxID=613905 RepID=UPI0010FB3228|nr:uncharacterized protein LOC114937269 [Nylanderia fulva]
MQTRSATRVNGPSATTLNPPARQGLPRIKAIEKVSIKIPLQKRTAGGRKEMGNKNPNPNPNPQKTAPRSAQPQPQTAWTTVVSRKTAKRERKKERKETTQQQLQQQQRKAPPTTPQTKGQRTGPQKKRKEPRTAAVTITCPPGEYEATMAEAHKKMESLESLGIKGGVKIRRAVTGALVYEIPGEGGNELADKLALGLKRALSGKEGVRVQRPTKTAELRLRGLDEAVTLSEIREAISKSGNCEEEEINVGEVKRAPNGIKMVWARCPLRTANTITQKSHIQIGWAMVRVEL